jgi:hypothetical protein
MEEEHPDQRAPERLGMRLGVPLLELKPGQCRFIVSGSALPARFCGDATVRGGSWCAEHRRLVYVPSSLRSR